MDTLLPLLSKLSEESLRLLLDGHVTLSGVHPSPNPHQSPPDYVSAIVKEVRHMSSDLQAKFLAGSVTIRQVREEMLRRHVVGKRIKPSDARLLNTFSVDLATISAFASNSSCEL